MSRSLCLHSPAQGSSVCCNGHSLVLPLSDAAGVRRCLGEATCRVLGCKYRLDSLVRRSFSHLIVLGGFVLPLPAACQALTAEEASGQAAPEVRAEVFRSEAPLHFALRERNYNDALVAMRTHVDFDEVAFDENGRALRPLCLAAQDSSADAYDMVRALIRRYGADPNVHDGRGFTPLHYASSNGNLAVVETLVIHGADVNALVTGDESPVTPLYLATQFGMDRVAAFLRAHGADDLDRDLASQLKVDAAMEQARMAAMVRVADEELPFPDALRLVYKEVTSAAATELEAAGRFEEASIWRKFGDQSAEVVIQQPQSADVAPDAWIAGTMQALMTEIEASVAAIDGSAGSP